MSVVETKRAFAKTYLQLISLSDNVLPDQFYSTSDYSKLESLGPSLPTMKLPFPEVRSKGEDELETVRLQFKSIRPPFKFSSELSGVSTSETIYKVKTTLIDQVEILKSNNVLVGDLKLMMKSKVAQDSATIKSLLGDKIDDISFNVMVSPPQVKPQVDEDPEIVEPTTILGKTWEAIYQVLKNDLGDSKANEVLAKFKSIYNA